MEDKKINILFLMLSFPNVEKSFNLYTDLVEEFQHNGHNVFVTAPALGQEKTGIYKEKELTVLRVSSMNQFPSSKITKGIANVLLPYSFNKAICQHFKNQTFDLVVFSTPTIMTIDVAAKIKKRFKSKLYLILRDIFPQNAVDLSMIRGNGIIHKFFLAKERKLYRLSDYIGCMSQGNIDFVRKQNPEIASNKLHLLPNWQKRREYVKPESTIREKYNLEGKFIAIFGGNLGLPQCADNILELAKVHLDKQDVIFLIIGKGTQKQQIIEKVHREKIDNVRILDYLPPNDYKELAGECDLGLVSLSGEFTIPNIPSRTLGYWSAKIPVFAIIDKNTDYGREILDNNNAGTWCIVGDVENYKKKFEEIYFNDVTRVKMGENGYNTLMNKYNSENAYKTIISVIQNV